MWNVDGYGTCYLAHFGLWDLSHLESQRSRPSSNSVPQIHGRFEHTLQNASAHSKTSIAAIASSAAPRAEPVCALAVLHVPSLRAEEMIKIGVSVHISLFGHALFIASQHLLIQPQMFAEPAAAPQFCATRPYNPRPSPRARFGRAWHVRGIQPRARAEMPDGKDDRDVGRE